MGLPGDCPLCLESATICFKEARMIAGWDQSTDRCFTEVVDKDVLGESNFVACPSDAQRIVIVLEETELKTLVQWTHAHIYIAAKRNAEHGQHRNFDQF